MHFRSTLTACLAGAVAVALFAPASSAEADTGGTPGVVHYVHTETDAYTYSNADAYTYTYTHSNTYCDSNSYAYRDTGADHARCARLQGAGTAKGGSLLEWSYLEQHRHLSQQRADCYCAEHPRVLHR